MLSSRHMFYRYVRQKNSPPKQTAGTAKLRRLNTRVSSFFVVLAVMSRFAVGAGRYRNLRQLTGTIVPVVMLAGAYVAHNGLLAFHNYTSFYFSVNNKHSKNTQINALTKLRL